MAFQYPVVVQNQGHSPMVAPQNQLHPTTLPVSAYTGNQLRPRADGLYAGSIPDLPTLYVTSTGIDAATGGARATPLKTLDYALQLVQNNYRSGQNITVALAAGQTFPMTVERYVSCNLTLTYWNDPIYGDFDSAQVTTAANATMADLTRPIITPSTYVSSAGAWRVSAIIGSFLALSGVRVDLPIRPAPAPDPASYGMMDFFLTVPDQFSGRLRLFGAIINALDALAVSGIMSVMSRTQMVLDQFASQFLVAGQPVIAGSGANELTRRTSFIKFYSDYPGGNTGTAPALNPTALNSSNGSGLLNLHWTDTTQQQLGSTTNVGTYPILTDANFGLRQYFTGLRKNGAIPVNVISPRVGL